MIVKLILLIVLWITTIRFVVPTTIGKVILSIPFAIICIMIYVIYLGEIK